MTKKKYNTLHSTLQRLAASATGAGLIAPVLHYLDNALLRLSHGRTSFSSLLTGIPVVIVTTTGARSSLPRTLPLLCVREENHADIFALIATNFGRSHYPGWYYNLKANPRVRCSIERAEGEYLAHEANGEEYDRFWERAIDIFPGYDLYRQRIRGRKIPIMVVQPLEK